MMRRIFFKPNAIITCFASALVLAGCASNKTSYMGIKFPPTQNNLALDNISNSNAALITVAKKQRTEEILACEAIIRQEQKVIPPKPITKPVTVQKPKATKEPIVVIKAAPRDSKVIRLHSPPFAIKNRPPPVITRPCRAKFQNSRISLMEALVHAELPILARRASIGDKYAQLELGIRFEEGRGLGRDLKKARKLYAKAASDSGGTTQVYLPPVDRAPGRLYPVYKGPLRKGLAEARQRLIKLEPRMEKAK